MADNELDPVIHTPTRLRIVAALAALEDGDSLSFSRLQSLLDLTPGNLITHLRRLEEAGYVATTRSRPDRSGTTAVALTHAGRAALDRYAAAVQRLLGPAVRLPQD